MEFLKKWWNKKGKKNLFSGSLKNELNEFYCGIGKSKINISSIKIWKYPFEPSTIFPTKEIFANEIDEIHLEKYPPTLKVGIELIFISKEHVDRLKEFALRNNVKTTKRESNWDWITEPFLDTEFDDEQKERTTKLLSNNGIFKGELNEIRNEISEQMYKYNFDKMIWEWGNLRLDDVLSAMKPTLSTEKFKEFYWKAMEIEQRKSNYKTPPPTKL